MHYSNDLYGFEKSHFLVFARKCLLTISTVGFALLFANQLHAADEFTGAAIDSAKPNIVLVMTDDQGWGQTGYNGHPILRTPNLDAMAENGLRFNRFYAAGPVCSPTRASVLTGRTHRRTGVESHGYALRRQEKTIAQLLQGAGYATGHFGKWHLNGLRGPGVPILANDSHHPGVFGFDQWLSVTNFFDRDPILSQQGEFQEFQGDSSEIVVDEALKFIAAHAKSETPSFTVIWFGTPHVPFIADPNDTIPFATLDNDSKNHYGELVAMDRSIGTLRKGLRDLAIANNTIVWFTSDNGGLPKVKPDTVGGLRGFKGSLYEGGIRVPAIIEWPATIKPRVTDYPAFACDILPTLTAITELTDETLILPIDGLNLTDLFDHEIERRAQSMPFSFQGSFAIIDNDYKLLALKSSKKKKRQAKTNGDENAQTVFELYDLSKDAKEHNNLIDQLPQVASKMKDEMANFQSSLNKSIAGLDYPEGEVNAGEPAPQFWTDVEAYKPYFDQWSSRPEYESRLKPKK